MSVSSYRDTKQGFFLKKSTFNHPSQGRHADFSDAQSHNNKHRHTSKSAKVSKRTNIHASLSHAPRPLTAVAPKTVRIHRNV